MDLSQETLNALLLVLPGLMAVLIYDTAAPRGAAASTSRRLLEVLAYTVTIRVIVVLVTGVRAPVIRMDEGVLALDGTFSRAAVLLTAVLALALPLAMAGIVGGDWHMGALRGLRITRRTSRTSVWHDTFAVEGDRFVVVHLNDGRRLTGYPKWYSTDPSDGFLFLDEPAWIVEAENDSTRDVLIAPGLHGTLLNREKIHFIEFLPTIGEQRHRPAAAQDTEGESS